MSKSGFLQGDLDLGLGFEVGDTADGGGVRDRGVDEVREVDGFGGLDKVVALLVLVESAVNAAERDCRLNARSASGCLGHSECGTYLEKRRSCPREPA